MYTYVNCASSQTVWVNFRLNFNNEVNSRNKLFKNCLQEFNINSLTIKRVTKYILLCFWFIQRIFWYYSNKEILVFNEIKILTYHMKNTKNSGACICVNCEPSQAVNLWKTSLIIYWRNVSLWKTISDLWY